MEKVAKDEKPGYSHCCTSEGRILGTEGMKWLADLDDLLEELEQEVCLSQPAHWYGDAGHLAMGFIQSLSTGLFLLQGMEQSGIQMLRVAEAWAKA